MITVEHRHGVGVNGYYHVLRDDQHVASIERYGRSHFRIYSVHYREQLGIYGNINRARAAADTLDYPSAWAVYETVCQRIEQERRQWYEQDIHAKLVQAARDLAAGSNSAHDRLVELVNEIETFARNRDDNEAFRRRISDEAFAHAKATGTAYRSPYSGPSYPNPPGREP